ncbi:calcium-transporting ATPase 12, plasma membrane-type-like [Olea europaea var. sylvestris]|uniref:calcium-transporting ATPase 12, plasma membrane-type-like n=1 Tax=Olea europaea var. sylvestris TaxID=158386 RepID=UPI000C1CEB0C|nr:calcium-transporting ATPase 12, plasma membrane-type-like [Olea europaea var. sylvestris]
MASRAWRYSIEGVLLALETDMENGVRGDQTDIDSRRKAFGSNLLPEYNLQKTLRRLVLEAIRDPMIAVLFICAVLSLCFGIEKHGLRQGWQEGLTKILAILVVVIDSSSGKFCYQQRIPICHVLVGDIVFLKPGDQVPADGLFIDGCSLNTEMMKTDGTVVDGYARMLVTGFGKNVKHHGISLRGSLIDELKRITSIVGKSGKTVALLTFMVFLVRFLTGKLHDDNGKRVSFGGETRIGDVLAVIVGILATPTMIALTSTPEDLVSAVRTCLAYSMKRLMKIQIIVREPLICHKVASITTVCMNKTGTLTMDSMEVTKFWQGLNSIEEVQHNLIAPSVLELLHQGIGLNTTQPPSRSSSSSSINSTEKTIFEWAIKQLDMDVESLKKSCTILEINPLKSKNRQSGVLISKNGDNTIHVHRKGGPEVIIPMCSHYYESTGNVKVMNKGSLALSEQILAGMAENGFRYIAFAHGKTSIRDYFTFSRQQLILLGLPGEVIDGEEFRKFSSEELMAKIENICVLPRATPDDKLLMVQSLKQKGHVVAFIGRGIGDAQALREANVGLCFGTQGAEIVKACSAIVMSCKDFPFIIDILTCGRGIYDSVQIYTQFLLIASFVLW